jgi:hypothetical protein
MSVINLIRWAALFFELHLHLLLLSLFLSQKSFHLLNHLVLLKQIVAQVLDFVLFLLDLSVSLSSNIFAFFMLQNFLFNLLGHLFFLL